MTKRLVFVPLFVFWIILLGLLLFPPWRITKANPYGLESFYTQKAAFKKNLFWIVSTKNIDEKVVVSSSCFVDYNRLTTLILALFVAFSPYFYVLVKGGFLYQARSLKRSAVNEEPFGNCVDTPSEIESSESKGLI